MHVLGLVWVRLTREDFEALKPAFAQLVFREHTRHGAAQDLLRLGLKHGLEGNLLETTRVHGVVAVYLLLSLASRHSNVGGIRHYHIVASVDGRIIDGLVFSH